MKEAAVLQHGHGPLQTRAAAVTVEDVSKVFGSGPSAVTALERASFEVPQGSFVSILAPSCCGKSTMLRLIAGLQPATSGTIEFDDRTPAAMRRPREFGIVFQQPIL